MINDTKIDLTENRDFSPRITPLDVDWLFTTSLDSFYDDDKMSNEEWEMAMRLERFFGRTRHMNEKNVLFAKDDEAYSNELRTHCHRCGKLIRIPWGKRNDLCPECDRAMDERIPWNEPILASVEDATVDNLFNLR